MKIVIWSTLFKLSCPIKHCGNTIYFRESTVAYPFTVFKVTLWWSNSLPSISGRRAIFPDSSSYSWVSGWRTSAIISSSVEIANTWTSQSTETYVEKSKNLDHWNGEPVSSNLLDCMNDYECITDLNVHLSTLTIASWYAFLNVDKLSRSLMKFGTNLIFTSMC